MTPVKQADAFRPIEVIPLVAALLPLAGATTLLSLWLFAPELREFSSGSMKFNTAVGIILASLSLLFLREFPRNALTRRAGAALAAAVLAVGALTLVEYLTGRSFGIDEWAVHDLRTPESSLFPGRMSPIAATCFVLLSFALLGLALRVRSPLRRRGIPAFVVPGALFALLALTGYAYGVQAFYRFGPYIRISWQTASCLLLLNVGVLFAQSRTVATTVLTSSGLGGVTARRLIPFAVLIPLGLGWLRVMGQRYGFYDLALGTALRSVSSVVLFMAVIWFNARLLDKSDEERSRLTERFMAIYDHAPFAIIVLRYPSTVIVDVNRSFTDLFGFEREEAVGKTSLDLGMHASPDNRKPVAETLERDGRARGVVSEVRSKDGRRVVVSQSVDRVTLEGQPHILVTLQDITVQKQAEESMRQALQSRDEFLSIASHELKTPLTSLKLQAQSIQKAIAKGATPEPERVARLVGHVDRQVSRLARLVDDMLDIARIRSGRLSIERGPVDLVELVRDGVDRLASGSEDGPRITLSAPDAPIVGHWDRVRLEQVLANLLTNAVKYGEGSPIQVTVERAGERSGGRDGDSGGERARVRVRDGGRGIADQDQARIFDRFERAVSPNGVSGLGLGLYIARQIMESHGGTLGVSSRVGEGSEFIVELPIAPAA